MRHLNWFGWYLAINWGAQSIYMIYMVHRPRARITRFDAAFSVVTTAIAIWLLFLIGTGTAH